MHFHWKMTGASFTPDGYISMRVLNSSLVLTPIPRSRVLAFFPEAVAGVHQAQDPVVLKVGGRQQGQHAVADALVVVAHCRVLVAAHGRRLTTVTAAGAATICSPLR